MIVADNRVLRIGAWRVDPTLDEISRGGTTVKLEPRAMRVLLCLAEHAGQVVSVDQLLDAVWKDVIVTPDSYDNYFPLETAQKPLYRLLGTPLADKKMFVYPSGHLVPRVEFMKETLAWLDEYLGPAQRAAQ